MKNREFINKGLYFEGLRRIKLPALIVAIVLSIEAILVPVAIGISDYIARANAERYNYPYDGTANSYSGAELHLLLFILIFAAPILYYFFVRHRLVSDNKKCAILITQSFDSFPPGGYTYGAEQKAAEILNRRASPFSCKLTALPAPAGE